MTHSKLHANHGGMTPGAFGGHGRLDKCVLTGPSMVGEHLYDVVSNAEGERTLWVQVILDAANNYLFFGLGRNGTTAEEFWYACEFLFRVRAAKPETWQSTPQVVSETYLDEQSGRRVTRSTEYSENDIKAMCLDTIWNHLDFPMSLEIFCARLKTERHSIIRANNRQIWDYLALPSKRPTSRTSFVELVTAFSPAFEALLVCPETPEEMEELIRYRMAHKAEALEVAA